MRRIKRIGRIAPPQSETPHRYEPGRRFWLQPLGELVGAGAALVG
jgi:hypothetical protein